MGREAGSGEEVAGVAGDLTAEAEAAAVKRFAGSTAPWEIEYARRYVELKVDPRNKKPRRLIRALAIMSAEIHIRFGESWWPHPDRPVRLPSKQRQDELRAYVEARRSAIGGKPDPEVKDRAGKAAWAIAEWMHTPWQHPEGALMEGRAALIESGLGLYIALGRDRHSDQQRLGELRLQLREHVQRHQLHRLRYEGPRADVLPPVHGYDHHLELARAVFDDDAEPAPLVNLWKA